VNPAFEPIEIEVEEAVDIVIVGEFIHCFCGKCEITDITVMN
jgi:hypothetical protein